MTLRIFNGLPADRRNATEKRKVSSIKKFPVLISNSKKSRLCEFETAFTKKFFLKMFKKLFI